MAGLHGWHVSIQLHTFGKLLWSKQFHEASEFKPYLNPVVHFIILEVLHLYSISTSRFQCYNYAVTAVITVQVIDQVLLVIEDNHKNIILEWN